MSAGPDISREDLDRLIDGTERLAKAVGGNNSTSGVHIHGGGLLAVLVGMVGILGIVVAVAAVFVVAAWRDADIRDLTRVRGDVRELQAYRQQQGDRINRLEAGNVESESNPER